MRSLLPLLVVLFCGLSYGHQQYDLKNFLAFEDGSIVQLDSNLSRELEMISLTRKDEDNRDQNFYRLTQKAYPPKDPPVVFFSVFPYSSDLYKEISQDLSPDKKQIILITNLKRSLLVVDTQKFKELFPKVYPKCPVSEYPYQVLQEIENKYKHGQFKSNLELFDQLPWQIAPGNPSNYTGINERDFWIQLVSGLPWCVSAAFNGQKDILAYLINEKKADINAQMDIRCDSERFNVGHNALTAALSRFNVDCLQFLLADENCDPNATVEVKDASPHYPFLRIFSHHVDQVYKDFITTFKGNDDKKVVLECWRNTDKLEYEMLKAFLDCPKVDVTVQENNQSIVDLCVEKLREDCVWLLCQNYLQGKSEPDSSSDLNNHYLTPKQIKSALETVQSMPIPLDEQEQKSLQKIKDMLSESQDESCTLAEFLKKFPDNPRDYTSGIYPLSERTPENN